MAGALPEQIEWVKTRSHFIQELIYVNEVAHEQWYNIVDFSEEVRKRVKIWTYTLFFLS